MIFKRSHPIRSLAGHGDSRAACACLFCHDRRWRLIDCEGVTMSILPQPSRNGRTHRNRTGATVVEFAIIAPLVFLLLIGFAVLATGVYRYQQVAYLAREGARYASTHGAQYRVDNKLPMGNTTTWSDEIRDQAIMPAMSSLSPSRMTVAVSWSAGDNRS